VKDLSRREAGLGRSHSPGTLSGVPFLALGNESRGATASLSLGLAFGSRDEVLDPLLRPDLSEHF
jgi:hypothetical protein